MFESIKAAVAANPLLTGVLGASSVGGALIWLRGVPARIWHLIVLATTITVDVENSDQAYFWLGRWLAQTEYAVKCRRLSATTGKVVGDGPALRKYENVSQFILFPSVGLHFFRAEGSWVLLTRTRDDGTPSNQNTGRKFETIHLRVLGRNRKALYSILESSRRLAEKEKSHSIQVYGMDGSYWDEISSQPKRPLGSVILPGKVMEDLVSDMRWFTGASNWYLERGVPYRRGYLLYGPPGCGKTSAVSVLATELEMSICVVGLNSLDGEDQLRAALSRTPAGSILLIEDVDAAFSEPREGVKRVSFSGLLNIIDGAGTEHGQIIIMTTNHPDKLDPALVRPGRVDIKQEFPLATEEVSAKMFQKFFPGKDHKKFSEENAGKSGADIQMALMELSKNDKR